MARTHGNPLITEMMKELTRLGFKITRGKSGNYKICPPENLGTEVYFTHGTAKAYKALRAYYRKKYGIKL
jgi:hypothetical protein